MNYNFQILWKEIVIDLQILTSETERDVSFLLSVSLIQHLKSKEKKMNRLFKCPT